MNGVMIQGTASDVGKSYISIALCRIFARENKKVAPFKSLNMTRETKQITNYKEISSSIWLQAKAALVTPSTWMNPIVIKPEINSKSQYIILGQSLTSSKGGCFRSLYYEQGLQAIKQSLIELDKYFDLIIMEGSGSPVEVNLRDKELVNMKIAKLANAPVVLVADIERGGLFASVVGTLKLLSPNERKRIKGIIINKFRGQTKHFKDGKEWLEKYTGIPVLGIVPYGPNYNEAYEKYKSKEKNLHSYIDCIADHVAKYIELNQIRNLIFNCNAE